MGLAVNGLVSSEKSMGRLFHLLRRAPAMNEKLDQIEAEITRLKKLQSKRQTVQPWSSRPKPAVSHPLLKQKAS